MENQFGLELIGTQAMPSARETEASNHLTEKFGLSLSLSQMMNLTERRFLALKKTDRIEFGDGVIKKLIYAFCDSPYVSQANFENIILELQDLFYFFKSESLERISDDDLIEAMKCYYNDKAQGSMEYLAGTALEQLCRSERNSGLLAFDNGAEEDDYDEWN